MESTLSGSLAQEYLRYADAAPEAPSLAYLARLQRGHIGRFTFNSLGVILGHELSLEPQALLDRVVARRRGGYCFEHNKLFYETLRELGFSVRLALGRVLLNRQIDAPLTHRTTIVTLDGRDYLVEVGFGPATPREPLPLDTEAESVHDGHRYRIVVNGDGAYELQTFVDGEPFVLYVFNRNRHTEADCELGHFYSHRHPQAVFVNNLVVSKILNGEVRSLRNTGFRRFDAYGFEDTPIENAAALRRILLAEFELDVPLADCERLYGHAAKAAQA